MWMESNDSNIVCVCVVVCVLKVLMCENQWW